MSEQFDFKKEYKDLYQPKALPMIVDVPKMRFIMVDGKGNPNDEAGEYAKAIELLYGLSYTIKMSKKSGNAPSAFFDYVVPPLEGLWWTAANQPFDTSQVDSLIWTAMIRQPEFVTKEVFQWAVQELKRRKPQCNISKARLEEFTEGLCVQMMHLGPYNSEATTVHVMDDFATSNSYVNAISELSPEGMILRHHEIYLNDPRRVPQEKIKTVIRHPIKKK